jgi:Spy/CpxP family protein refolding chaperone
MQAQRDAMQKSMDDTEAKIKSLLTPDQQKQFDAMPMPGGPGSPQAPKPGQ